MDNQENRLSQILLVEDDPMLGRSLSIKLDMEGYKVTWVTTLKEAERKLDEKPSILLIDVSLPDGNGVDFVRVNQERLRQMPVFVLTARTDEDIAVESLSIGVTEFIRKPFGVREFMARMKKALDEPVNYEPQLRVGELVILPKQRRILRDNVEIDLNRREYDIFYFMAQNIDRVVSRETIIGLMGNVEVSDRTVDSHVSHIRTRMREGGALSIKITPVYGIGYRLEKV